mmetsp:Transcript_62814/g.139864  ORF Transcript_62814/g.139864 Transcript_62814/m.139864 type:complete len:125 (-) Transcript_62814:221-595(-)
MNAFFMASGSAVVEIRPYGFEGEWPERYYKLLMNVEDAVLYFQLSIGSPGLCHMGEEAAAATTIWDARDRNCHIPQRSLERVFRSVRWTINETNRVGTRRRRRQPVHDRLTWTASVFIAYEDDR